jgi:hypothetical protein
MNDTEKSVCKCENCGNEAEMVITCGIHEDAEADSAEGKETPKPRKKKNITCTHCGNEADMWIDE